MGESSAQAAGGGGGQICQSLGLSISRVSFLRGSGSVPT